MGDARDRVSVRCVRAGGRGDAAWRATFVSLVGALATRVEARRPREAALALVAAVGRQLDTLLRYRAPAERRPQLRLQRTTRALALYAEIERPHVYIRYAHKLAALHAQRRHWAEAGLALRLHARLLEWSERPLDRALRPPGETGSGSAASSHRRLKEALCLDAVEYLHRGNMWEPAVEVVKELVRVFEEEALGYRPLMEMHLQLHRLYKAALETPRGNPGYFRVVHYNQPDFDSVHVSCATSSRRDSLILRRR